MKQIIDFAQRVGAFNFFVNNDLVVEKGGRYFLLDRRMFLYIQEDFCHAGTYLGKVRDGKFFPSFILLSMLAESGARSVFVDKKAAWLFICGRDIFAKGIVNVQGSPGKNDYLLVLNQLGECLGFGRALASLDSQTKSSQVAIKNISDIGDFLRRER